MQVRSLTTIFVVYNVSSSHANANLPNRRFFLTVCSYHVPYAFQSESTLYSCLNVKEGTPCSKQARNLNLKWVQLDSNPQPLSS